jgi:ADP-ribose pyrophosphatase
MSAKVMGGPIADGRAQIVVPAPQLLAKGFRPYERFRVAQAGEDTQTRDVLRVGPVAAVLPIDVSRDEVVLVRQFRLPAHLATGKGDLVEIVAGHVEAGEGPIAAARRECAEEIGIEPSPLIELFTYLTSPGISDEAITLFLGVVDASRLPRRAGLAAEHERIEIVRAPIDAALAALAAGAVHNGPLIIALQWLAINRARLCEIVGNGGASP